MAYITIGISVEKLIYEINKNNKFENILFFIKKYIL